MSGSADSDLPAISLPLQAKLLQAGEEIILAIKPSPWFLLVASWPMLVVIAALAAAVLLAERFALPQFWGPSLLTVLVALALLRIMVAAVQWMGYVYVLTNLRVIRVRGLLNTDVWQCSLRRLSPPSLAANWLEASLGLGTVEFSRCTPGAAVPPPDRTEGAAPLPHPPREPAEPAPAATPQPGASWACVSRPQEVIEIIEQARRKAQ